MGLKLVLFYTRMKTAYPLHPPWSMSFQNEIREIRPDFRPITVVLVGILSLLALTVSDNALAASASGMDCGTWTVDIKPGTYNAGDEIWSKGAAQFTHRHGTCPSGNETM